jgi:hypothetical protein
MRSYAQIVPQFWTGETGKQIRKSGRDVQVLALYLMTCPSSNMIGLYYLPLPVLCHELDMNEEGALKALRRVKEIDFAHYEPSEEVIWLPNMAKYQFGESLKVKDNRHKNVSQEAAKYSKSIFFKDFMNKYAKPYHLTSSVKQFIEEEGPCKPLRRVDGSHGEEQEQEQEQEHAPAPSRAAVPKEEIPIVGTSEEREASRRAFDQWSHVSRGKGLSVERAEHTKIHSLLATLAQGPPVLRGRESLSAHKLVPFAADALRQEGQDFKGIGYACQCVQSRIEEWIVKGMPSGGSGTRGAASVGRPSLRKTVLKGEM